MKKVLSTMTVLAAAAGVMAGFAGAAHAQDAKAGEKKVSLCIGCHNIPGYQSSFPEVHKVPKIAGQSAPYIVAALNAYKKGERKHPTMRGIAESLTDQDMADIAAWYEQLAQSQPAPDKPSKQPSAQVAQLLQKGACVSCHGENFNKAIDPSYPKLAGQYSDYLFVALKSYKTENNRYIGRSNAIMAAQVKQFSNAELKLIADYIGSLQGEMKTVGQDNFR